MRTERLVRMVGRDDEPLIDTYHDQIRETVLGGMEDATRRGLHRALGETIERAGAGGLEEAAASGAGPPADGHRPAPARVYDLAYHFDAAGEAHKARDYGLLAAEQARRQLALEVAANHYALAIAQRPGGPGRRPLADRRGVRRIPHAPGTIRGRGPATRRRPSIGSMIP